MYRTSAQITSAIQILSAWFPNFFTQQQLPEPSVQGQSIYALRLRAAGGSSRAVLIVGGTHARELMNPDAIVDLAIDLFLSYVNGTDIVYGNRRWTAEDIKLILESLDIWMIPCTNPDGRDEVMNVDSLWRKNMRVNAGNPTCPGVDLNRNSDIVWGVAQGQTSCSPCSDVYCGPGVFSEPETRNVKSLLDSEPFVSFVDVHSYSELVLYPWGHAPTQSTDPSQVFTTLATGTCTASVPSSYAEYMPALDVQRFTSVAGQIVDDIAAVRGRQYIPETAFALYPTTGTQSDYGYARHIANSKLNKTYGFTFETGPLADTADDSFHPADPTLIELDAKAGMISLLMQSICAIDLIGINLFASGAAGLRAFRRVRDEALASTQAGREWVALFERLQFAMLARVIASPKLMKQAKELLGTVGRLLEDPMKTIDPEAVKRAEAFVRDLIAKTKNVAHRRDLKKVLAEVKRVSGRSSEAVVAGLLRRSSKQGPRRPEKRRSGKSPVRRRR